MDYVKPLLGEILMRRKKITAVQLEQALLQQKTKGGVLGEVIVSMGMLDERDIVVALVIQCGMPYIAVDKYNISPQTVQLIPEEVARRERVIALDRVGNILSIVTTNPLNANQHELLEGMTQCRLATFIATKTEIDLAISKNYRKL